MRFIESTEDQFLNFNLTPGKFYSEDGCSQGKPWMYFTVRESLEECVARAVEYWHSDNTCLGISDSIYDNGFVLKCGFFRCLFVTPLLNLRWWHVVVLFVVDEESFRMLHDYGILQGPVHHTKPDAPRWYRWNGKLGPHINFRGQTLCRMKVWKYFKDEQEPTDSDEGI